MQNGDSVKISVITAVYNNHITVGSALDSILSQSFANVELIVIDGVSTDGTMEVLRQYSDQIAVLLSEPDKGIYDALNKGIRNSSGDVVGFLHADDVFENTKVLAKVAEIGRAHV